MTELEKQLLELLTRKRQRKIVRDPYMQPRPLTPIEQFVIAHGPKKDFENDNPHRRFV